MKKIIIGVDVSAKTLDICVKDENKLYAFTYKYILFE